MDGSNPAVGHNRPPDPIDEALAPFSDAIAEAENWLDGEPVENEGQMKAVDALIADIRKAGTALASAKKSSTAPLHDAWKAEIARWKPTEDDIERIKKSLVALVDPFKRKLAAEKAEAERKAREEAEAKRREAEVKAREARAGDIESQREAARAQAEAEASQKAAAKAGKDKPKGLRTVTKFEITSHRDLLAWLYKNRPDDIAAFLEEWARRNHRETLQADGLRVWQEKGAY